MTWWVFLIVGAGAAALLAFGWWRAGKSTGARRLRRHEALERNAAYNEAAITRNSRFDASGPGGLF